MDVPDPQYRENSKRAVFLFGEINQFLVEKLTPEILRLRQESHDPITVYIDSLGGGVAVAETLRNLITCPDQDGRQRRLITVVTGTAASAAADFLALGDYSIAYPHSRIIYHGTRRSASSITVEKASSLAQQLQNDNEWFALRLAKKAFGRFIPRMFWSLGESLQKYINDAGVPDIGVIINDLKKRVTQTHLIETAWERQQSIHNLSEGVLTRFRSGKRTKKLSELDFEMKFFKAILKKNEKDFSKNKILLSEGGMSKISADFQLLLDFYFGDYSKSVKLWTSIYGQFFLSKEETNYYNKLLEDDAKKTWVLKNSQKKIGALWYFMVSICRILQTDDFDLSPRDAYWLGLVNEVSGNLELPNERLMFADVAQSKEEVSS